LTERLAINALAHRGDGVAEGPGGAIHVACTLPGEIVEVEPLPGHADRRRLIRVVTASPERIAPVCAHFGVCGGCSLQHWDPARYQEWKRGLLVAALAQAGVDSTVEALVDAHGQGRRRATFHARRNAQGVLEVGFAAQRAHRIIGIDHCPVLAPAMDGAIAAARAVAEALKPAGKPLDIQVTATDDGLDMDVRGSGALKSDQAVRLASLAGKHRLARLTRHGELIAQGSPPTLMIGRARVALPPGVFLQATAAGETTLAALVAEHAKGARRIADLFCGVGPFALRLAEKARVFACDSNAEAVSALGRAAAATPGLKPVQAETRDLFRRPLAAPELKPFDAVVFDPPRQGAQAQATALAQSAVASIVAVSCNPMTFARDARLLVDGGYRLVTATPVDQFRYSPHVEIVARFERVRTAR